ncbi:MAG: hypothetical protein Q8K32_22475 [Archangium sp.]|nr:hypothetical protein [Archangium sp.]
MTPIVKTESETPNVFRQVLHFVHKLMTTAEITAPSGISTALDVNGVRGLSYGPRP